MIKTLTKNDAPPNILFIGYIRISQKRSLRLTPLNSGPYGAIGVHV